MGQQRRRLPQQLLLQLLLLLPADSSPAPVPASAALASGRWHFRFAAAPPFEISVLFRRSAAGDETRLLVDSPAGRFEMLSSQDPSGRITFESITDRTPGGSGETLSRRLFLPGVPGPVPCPPPDRAAGEPALDTGCAVFEGVNGKVAASLAAFGGTGGEAIRARARSVVSSPFAARLAALRPLFPRSVEFDAYGDDFVRLAWPEAKGPRPPRERGVRTPGCAFDAPFGFPCDERDLAMERVRFARH